MEGITSAKESISSLSKLSLRQTVYLCHDICILILFVIEKQKEKRIYCTQKISFLRLDIVFFFCRCFRDVFFVVYNHRKFHILEII